MSLNFITHITEKTEPMLTMAIVRISTVAFIWCNWAMDFHLRMTFQDPLLLITATVFFTSTISVFFGLYTKLFKWLLFLVMSFIYFYLGFEYGYEPYTHHHRYILLFFTLIIALSTSERSLSIDAYLSRRFPNNTRNFDFGYSWPRYLLCIQTSALYFWTAFDKTSHAFLSGEKMEQFLMYIYFGSDYPIFPFFHLLCQIFSILTVLLEYALVVLLWIPKFRAITILSAMIFHALLYFILPVGTFTLSMWLLYLTFINPNRTKEVLLKII